jgi:hypothetical protein
MKQLEFPSGPQYLFSLLLVTGHRSHNIMGRIRMHNLEMAGNTILPSQNVIAGTLIDNGCSHTDLYVLVGLGGG